MSRANFRFMVYCLWFIAVLFFLLFPSTISYQPSTVFAQTATPTPVTGSVIINNPQPIPASSSPVIVPNPVLGDREIYPGSVPVNVNAQVGEYIVNVSGLSSPNASVVLSDDNGQFLRSTVADNTGNFYISQLTVRKGFDGFCLQSVDFKRIGESEGCLNFAPITRSQDFKDVFLPPTIGLFQKQINEGDQAIIYGFSMPDAKVKVKIQNNLNVDLTTDPAGYYEYRYEKVPAGTYDLSSTATYNKKASLKPKKTARLVALSLTDQAIGRTAQTGKTVGNLLTTTLFGFLLILLLLIIIIIVLIIIIKHGGIAYALDKIKRKRPLHHDWFLEFLSSH